MVDADSEPRLLEGLDAIAHFLGVSVDTVQRRIADAALPVGRDARGHYFARARDLASWNAGRVRFRAARPKDEIAARWDLLRYGVAISESIERERAIAERQGTTEAQDRADLRAERERCDAELAALRVRFARVEP